MYANCFLIKPTFAFVVSRDQKFKTGNAMEAFENREIKEKHLHSPDRQKL